MTRPEPDLSPYPKLVEPAQVGGVAAAIKDELREEDRRWDRARTVTVACTIVNAACSLSAAVLIARIVIVMSDANPGNGIGTVARSWSAGVSLGFDGLFTPSGATVGLALNYGLAAIVWLCLGAATTALIRRLALPARPGLRTGASDRERTATDAAHAAHPGL